MSLTVDTFGHYVEYLFKKNNRSIKRLFYANSFFFFWLSEKSQH